MPLGHPVKYTYIWNREEGDKGAVRLLRPSGSPRAYALTMKRCGFMTKDICRCEEGTQVTDVAIHCMQWTRTDCAVRFSAHSVSPRAFTPRDDKVVGVMQYTSREQHTMSLRGKSEAKDGAIHCMQWARTGNAFRFPTHSGSPRAFSPRDYKV
jgi:hypothetical protein